MNLLSEGAKIMVMTNNVYSPVEIIKIYNEEKVLHVRFTKREINYVGNGDNMVMFYNPNVFLGKTFAEFDLC